MRGMALSSPARERSHQERDGGGTFLGLLILGGVVFGGYEWWEHRKAVVPAGCNPPCGPGCTCDPATLVCTCPIACTSPAGMPADFCTYSAVEQRCALIYRNLLGFWPNAAQLANAVAIWNCAGVYGEVGGHMCTSQPGENWTGTSWLAFRLISDQAQAFVKRVSARAGVAPVDPLPWAWIDACIEIVLGRPGNGQAGDPFEPGWLPQGGAQLGGELVPAAVLYGSRLAGAYGGTQIRSPGAWAGGYSGWTGAFPEFSARVANQLATGDPTACAAYASGCLAL